MALYFEDTRTEKPPLLLIAGLASDEVSWIFQKPEFAAKHRLISCDNRGVGRSPKPPGPYTIAAMAADVLELLDGLELEKVSLLGHSMGGAIAQYLAMEFPQRVDRLVLACTFSRLEGRSIPVVESWAGVLKLGASHEVVGNTLFPWLYTERFLSFPGNLDACISALAQHPYPMEGEPVHAQVAALRGFDSSAHLHRINAPTLVLAAEEDLLVSPSSCRALAEAIPGAKYELLPGTAHSCMLETPALFNQAVLSFLA
jgi:pimeloyl-ACP methyl ester carboxylesterase